MEEINTHPVVQFNACPKQSLGNCSTAFFNGHVTSKQLNSFLIKQQKKKSQPKSTKKRAPTAFFEFLNDNRARAKRDNPGATVSEIAKILGAEWNAMPDEEKSGYQNHKSKKSSKKGPWRTPAGDLAMMEEKEPAAKKRVTKRKIPEENKSAKRRSPRTHKGSD